jgi:SAM-dependent methyltransferase
VLITDQSEAMVEAVRRRSSDRPNVDVAVADAQALDVPDSSVDGVVSRFAVMLVPDVDAALGEIRRVLRPGGRVAFAVWASAPENPWASTVGRTMVELGHAEPPPPDAPGPFRLADRDRLAALVAAAGFVDTTIEDVELSMDYASFDEYWEVTRDLAMSLRDALGRLPPGEADELRSRIQQELEPYATANGLAIPGLARVVGASVH